jgi:ribonucleoside-diphosphate reductase alpha chain
MSKKIALSDNALEIAKSRYFNNGEDWETCTQRVAISTAAVEKNKEEYTSKFHEMIYNMDFLPGGRILRNAGKPKGSLFNCYVLPIGDSIEEIGQFIKDALILWSEGGGVGVNFSPLRPGGDPILGKGGKSSGMVSFIEAADSVSRTIESGGQRRAAALGCVNVSHPEVMDFIDAKLEKGKLTHFNISVAVDESFLTSVASNSSWTFKFKQKEYSKVPARQIWSKIVENMVKCAEPGLLNWSYLTKNNSYYYDPVVSTNPCGEAVLENYGVCCLGSLVLPNFITGNVNTNWNKLEKTIKLGVRFLDNIIDINKYSLSEVDVKAHNSRRIGIGIMGLAEYLFAKEVRYGSSKALAEVERLMRFIRDAIYTTMVELAIEKGAFPKFEPVFYGNASFIRKLPAQLRMDIKKHGARCVTAMAIAPTGTISLLPEVSSGVEPLFSKAYRRSDRLGERIYVHPKLNEFLSSGQDLPDWFVDTGDLKPEDHFEVQAMVQRYVDGAVSKTINLPEGTTAEQLDKLLLEYIHDLKGVTVYVDKTREGQVLERLDYSEAINHVVGKQLEATSKMSESDVDCNCPGKK